MGTKRLTYKDIPSSLRARTAGEAQRRLQTVLADPAATIEQRGFARRQQAVLRRWADGTLPTVVEGPLDYHAAIGGAGLSSATSPEGPSDHSVVVDESLSVRTEE